MKGDVFLAAEFLDYFAGLSSELKGDSIPTPGDTLNLTLREPYGVIGRIIPFNHPVFCAGGKIAAALGAGNTVLLKPAGETFARGFLVEPMIFDGVTMSMRPAREEIFGPALSVLTWKDRKRVIAEANQVVYGLTASIRTNDINLALDTARRIEAGHLWINGSSRHFIGVPFGGYQQSVLGREKSLEELLSYTQVKNVNVNVLL